MVPRLGRPRTPEREAALTYFENFAGRHGNRLPFIELMAGLDQIVQIAERSCARPGPSTPDEVRAHLARAFARQPEIFRFVRERHDHLEAAVRTELDLWIGRGLAAEVERARTAGEDSFGFSLHVGAPFDLAHDLGAVPTATDQNARSVRLGRAGLAVFGLHHAIE